jgi:hypothetical protein
MRLTARASNVRLVEFAELALISRISVCAHKDSDETTLAAAYILMTDEHATMQTERVVKSRYLQC